MQSTDVCVAGQKTVGHKRRKYAAYGKGRTGSPEPDLACRSFCSCRDHVGERCPQALLCTTPPCGKKLRQNTFSEVDPSRRKSSPATARSRSTRARTSQGSRCRLSSPAARARRSSVDLPNDRRRGTRQKRTRTAAARPLPNDTYKTDPREIYAENSMAKGKAGRHPLLCVRSALAGLIRRDGVQIRLSVAVQNEVCLSRTVKPPDKIGGSPATSFL